jgi:hypothetical protein
VGGGLEPEMAKDLTDHILILDECEDTHCPVAFRAGQRIHCSFSLSVSITLTPTSYTLPTPYAYELLVDT